MSVILGLCFSLLIRGPDILGYFSSLLHVGPYVQTSTSARTSGGIERPRKLGRMKIKLVNVSLKTFNYLKPNALALRIPQKGKYATS